MRNLTILIAGLLLASGAASAQTAAVPGAAPAAAKAASNLTFDVASVRPSPPPDMQKLLMDLQAGKKPESTNIDGSRVAFGYTSLKELIAYAYKLRVYEINGPDWMVTDRFDIAARMPDGASKDDVPDMLRALLAERFKLAAHQEMQDQPVLGLVVGKSGPKLKEGAPATADDLDMDAPLKPGQSKRDTPDGPMILTKNTDGSTTYNMGARGAFTLKFDGETRSMHMQASSISMKGFAMMMTTLGGGEGRQIVDMTGLTGRYQAGVDFSLMDLLGSLHDQGIEIPTGPGGPPGGGATDPEGGATVSAALDKLGLKLERTHATVQRLVIDHVEKMPTEN